MLLHHITDLPIILAITTTLVIPTISIPCVRTGTGPLCLLGRSRADVHASGRYLLAPADHPVAIAPSLWHFSWEVDSLSPSARLHPRPLIAHLLSSAEETVSRANTANCIVGPATKRRQMQKKRRNTVAFRASTAQLSGTSPGTAVGDHAGSLDAALLGGLCSIIACACWASPPTVESHIVKPSALCPG